MIDCRASFHPFHPWLARRAVFGLFLERVVFKVLEI